MCLDKQWTTICYEDLQKTAYILLKVQAVICRQLGSWAIGNIFRFDDTSGKHITNVKCQGNEHNISQCGRAEWSENCPAGKVLGMRCEPGIGKHEDKCDYPFLYTSFSSQKPTLSKYGHVLSRNTVESTFR